MTDIFREIDEELRRENFAKLWTRYGNYVIGLAVVVVLVTAGVVGWREWQSRQRQSEGMQYAAALALARQGQTGPATAAFAEIARTAGGGHAVLARFEEAALRIKAGDPAVGLALYDQLAADNSLDAPYRDLATVLAARYALDKEDAKAVAARLKPLTDAANPWRTAALELTALADLKAADKPAARAIYRQLADDLTAPQGLRARAAEMAAALAQ